MAGRVSIDTVTDGLVFLVDAKNTRSAYIDYGGGARFNKTNYLTASPSSDWDFGTEIGRAHV